MIDKIFNRRTVARRDFIKLATMATLGANITGCSRRARKPNLLFLWTDEQRADTMQAYGNPKIHAPNLNKLASESVVFQNAYVSQPVCTPSRSTVMTGLWPHTNGCTENNIPLPENIPCLPEISDDPDYRTGYFGKWHLGDEIFAQHGFEEWKSIEDGYARFYRSYRDRDQKSSYWHFLNELGYQPDTSNGTYSRGFAARRPLEHCKPKFLEQCALAFLQRYRNEPFMLYINFLEPHMPFFGPLDNEHQPDAIDLPENFNAPLDPNEPVRYQLLREKFRQQGFEGHDLTTESGWRQLTAQYWGLVTQVDLSVGAILNALEELGLAENTIVVYTSDHGDMMGSHRLLAKTVMYEEAVKVPWLMRIPQLGRHQKLIPNAVSHIDLVPTLLDLMGVRSSQPFPGKSLKRLMKGETVKNDPVFIEWNPAMKYGKIPHTIPTVPEEKVEKIHRAHFRTVISPDGWKLSLSDLDNGQLFNLKQDPFEATNLYYQKDHQAIISQLTKAIHTWQERVQDSIKI